MNLLPAFYGDYSIISICATQWLVGAAHLFFALQEYFPAEKKFAQVLKDKPEMDRAGLFNYRETFWLQTGSLFVCLFAC